MSAYGLGSVGASLVGGHLADRIGRRNSIALSMFASATAMVALSQADTLPLIVGSPLAGLAAEAYRPASARSSRTSREGDRVTAFALYRLAINLGFAAGPAAAGFLAERSFTALFIADAATSVVYGLVASPPSRTGGGRRGTRSAAARPSGRSCATGRSSSSSPAPSPPRSSTCSIRRRSRSRSRTPVSRAAYGTLAALNGIIIVVVELPLTTVTRRYPARPVIALGWLLVGVGFALTGLADTAFALALTVAVWTLGEVVSSPVSGRTSPISRQSGCAGATWARGRSRGGSGSWPDRCSVLRSTRGGRERSGSPASCSARLGGARAHEPRPQRAPGAGGRGGGAGAGQMRPQARAVFGHGWKPRPERYARSATQICSIGVQLFAVPLRRRRSAP